MAQQLSEVDRPPRSGDDIGEEPVFELDDLILKLQLLLLQPCQRQLVVRGRKLDLGKLGVQFPVLVAQIAKLLTQQLFVLSVHAKNTNVVCNRYVTDLPRVLVLEPLIASSRNYVE